MARVKIPEAIIVDSLGAVIAYVTEVNDAYSHQIFIYDAKGECLHTFHASEAQKRGWKTSFDVANWFARN